MHTFGELMHIFREVSEYFGKFVQNFAWKLVSRTSKEVSRNWGPLWQPGVYNDTNIELAITSISGPKKGQNFNFPPVLE